MRINKENSIPKTGIAGYIKVGEKDANGGYPKSLDYFRCTSKNAQFENVFLNTFKEKPTALPIIFADDNHEYNCTQYYELVNHSGAIAIRGDGENFEISEKEGWKQITKEDISKSPYKDGEGFMRMKLEQYQQKANDAAKSSGKKAKELKWSETLILRFILPHTGILGLWQFQTHGKDSTIPQIIAAYDGIKNERGTVTKYPFILSVAKVQSARELDFKRSYPVVSLMPLIQNDSDILKISAASFSQELSVFKNT